MVNVFRKIMLFTAFLLALVIFLGGLYTGFLLDNYRVDNVDNNILDKQLDIEGFIIERDFFQTFSVKDCTLLLDRMHILSADLVELGSTLARYDAKGISHDSSYEILRRKYFLIEMKTYIYSKQVRDICPDSNSNVILFFYNIKNNQESLNQGYVLDNIVKKYKDILILSFDKDFDDATIESLFDYYNVTVAPTIILNFDTKFEGYTPEYLLVQNIRK